MTRLFRLLSIALLLASAIPPVRAAEATPLVLEAKIPLGTVHGRIDHLAFDTTRQYVYVAELGNDSVGVVDLKQNKVVRTLTGLHEPQGIGYVKSADALYVANAADGSVRVYRGADLAPIGEIPLGNDADNVRVDDAVGRVYVGYGSGALAVIDTATRTKVVDIPLKEHPESFQLGQDGRRIFINIPDARKIAVVDRAANRAVGDWATDRLRANYPMALDEASHRVIAVFRHPARVGVFGEEDGRLVTSFETCEDSDDVFFDAKRQSLYVICGEGYIDVFAQEGVGFRRTGHIETSGGARTGLFIPDLGRLVLAVRATAVAPAALWVFRPDSALASGTGTVGAENISQPNRVVFVCEHGSVKSLVAMVYFNQRAHERGLPYQAVARGTAPQTAVPGPVREGLHVSGFDVSAFVPQQFKGSDLDGASLVVSFDQDIEKTVAGRVPHQRWDNLPGVLADFTHGRDEIVKHVDTLLDELTGTAR